MFRLVVWPIMQPLPSVILFLSFAKSKRHLAFGNDIQKRSTSMTLLDTCSASKRGCCQKKGDKFRPGALNWHLCDVVQ
jgi:hypothetical protein